MSARNKKETKKSDTVPSIFKIAIVLMIEYIKSQFYHNKDCFYVADINCNNLNLACTIIYCWDIFKDFY